ncbi:MULTISPECIES: tetratricopeptide repeat protein [unclassified Flavobacterium]|uniref:tetratricopeptide repeat protein n=1 Tax=unclassified Flavobacterium TaxID=196869 RepID=UPI0036127E14
MKTLKSLLILLLIVSFKSFACLNGESKILKSGHYLYEDYSNVLPFGHEFYENEFDEMVFKLDSLYKKTNDLAYLSDKGLVLILQKKYKEALQLYLNIEKKQPNKYSTASNIGTIYELIGDNQKALEWIKKAIEIDPNSHRGSEWIHVNILEAKIKGDNYITGEFLLGTDFGNESSPKKFLDTPKLQKLYRALFYQLNERISLVKPKDKIVATMLFELGNFRLLQKDYANAVIVFEKAKEYGFESELFKKRMMFAKEGLKKEKAKLHNPKMNYPKTMGLIVTILLGIFLVVKIVRRNKK